MSNIPLISHRMFVAAVAQERHSAAPPQGDEPQPKHDGYATLEVLDTPGWTNVAPKDEFRDHITQAEDV